MRPDGKRLIIGLTGPIGSGVSCVSQILADEGFKKIKLSRPIAEEVLRKEGKEAHEDVKTLEKWREKMQDEGDRGRKEDLAYWLKQESTKIPPDGHVVIDGIRNLGEIDYLRDWSSRFFLVAVIASSREERWNRIKNDYGNDFGLFEKVDKRDSEDRDDIPHGQQVGLCVNEADYVFVNDKPYLTTDARKANIWESISTPLGLFQQRKNEVPKEQEVHMASAYALSHRSRCLKRHVGAVIVSDKGIPLSSGFNENPLGMNPCVIAFEKTCFKDEKMHEKLENLNNFFCPECGKKLSKLQKPWKCPTCSEDLKRRFFPSRNMELCTAIHAEERAIRSLEGRSSKDATMYVTTFPCLQCSRYIVDAGITKVVYVEAYPVKEAVEYLSHNKVSVVPFSGFKARAFNIVYK